MIVVSDASVLINLDRIGQVSLLAEIYGEVLVPNAVWNEVARGLPELSTNLPEWIKVDAAADQELIRKLAADLDAGESESIVLALERRADLLLIDEQLGRRIAMRFGIRVSGLLGVLVVAKNRQLIPAVAPCIRELLAAGFWLSDEVIARVLKQTGE
ncbi:MAG: DUF3368 domain-containing protein [Opitutaceae bacterium]|nr:DUF3368 domain-containing protein [Opitutaceae bacterium]